MGIEEIILRYGSVEGSCILENVMEGNSERESMSVCF